MKFFQLAFLSFLVLALTKCKKIEYKNDCCSHEMEIYPCGGLDSLKVYAPNAFTPNFDGINEVFEIAFDNVSSTDFYVKIFQKKNALFESIDPNFKWNGVINQKVKEGIYEYFVRAKTESGKPFELKGKFCLLLNNDNKNTPIKNCETCVFPDMIDARHGLIFTTDELLQDCE